MIFDSVIMDENDNFCVCPLTGSNRALRDWTVSRAVTVTQERM